MSVMHVVTVDLESGETYNGESYYQDVFDTLEDLHHNYSSQNFDYDGFSEELVTSGMVNMDGRTYTYTKELIR